ncbi:Fic family protein [Rickettsiales bacterium]|nr:Fic family protein [Rickettsiales bacterium]
MAFTPKFQITSTISKNLMTIEANKEVVNSLPITPKILASLRESAKLITTHYSTMIEGNKLNEEEIVKVIKGSKIKAKQRDEKEVLGYYAALEYVHQIADKNPLLNEKIIQTIHAIVMSSGNPKARPTKYRDGQNVIRDSGSGAIVYMPPEAKDVSMFMLEMTNWINKELDKKDLPLPIIAAIAHYQFATIHPYYDGNGRTARLLTTLILHLSGYGLKGIYCLEEYYAKDLGSYYQALSIGSHHNYYMGRAESDITSFIEYFCSGMAKAFESVRNNIVSSLQSKDNAAADRSDLLYHLDERQKRALDLFLKQKIITTKDISLLFGLGIAASNNICRKWLEAGFVEASSEAKKNRGYFLAKKWHKLID